MSNGTLGIYFLAFYRRAFDHLLSVNLTGYAMEESYASLLLSELFTSFGHGYVDLRSPSGAGLGAVIYDHDGRVYPSDEARMLAAMGDDAFALGHVSQSVSQWLSSPAMARLMDAGVAEALAPGASGSVWIEPFFVLAKDTHPASKSTQELIERSRLSPLPCSVN